MSNQDLQNNLQAESSVIHSFGFWLAAVWSLIVVEQLSKVVVTQLHRTIFLNNNFAFSIPVPSAVMYLIYAVVFAVMIRMLFAYWTKLSLLARFGWALVIAGGLSNVIERVVLGYVRDFIYIAHGIFNFADFFIVIGLLIIVFTYPKNTWSGLELASAIVRAWCIRLPRQLCLALTLL